MEEGAQNERSGDRYLISTGLSLLCSVYTQLHARFAGRVNFFESACKSPFGRASALLFSRKRQSLAKHLFINPKARVVFSVSTKQFAKYLLPKSCFLGKARGKVIFR